MFIARCLAVGLTMILGCVTVDGSVDGTGLSGGSATTGEAEGTGTASGPSDGSTGATTSTDAGSSDESSSEESGMIPMTGQELYLARCASCHGASGEGTALGYELRHPVREFSTWVVRNGRAGDEFETSAMPAYPETNLSDAELADIFDFLDTFEQPADAEGLYLDHCGNCHGADGEGGIVGTGLENDFGDARESVREGKGGADFGARTAYMPAIGEARLTDEELMLIVGWLPAD